MRGPLAVIRDRLAVALLAVFFSPGAGFFGPGYAVRGPGYAGRWP